MTERMIPVSVSLIERIAASSIEKPDEDALIELSHLLSQPSLTKEQVQRLILDASAEQLAAEEAAEKPMCGSALNTGSSTYKCVEDEGHSGKHMSFSGIWWSR